MSNENTRLTCPDCGGSLQRVGEDTLVQYRCRIGHLYSPQSALFTHAEREENTLWTAVVILEEGAELAEEIASKETDGDSQALRAAAMVKRELAARVRQVAIEFAEILQAPEKA
jgi:two-component system chemotaxis response regulator CheB